jgi:hypothetical protein
MQIDEIRRVLVHFYEPMLEVSRIMGMMDDDAACCKPRMVVFSLAVAILKWHLVGFQEIQMNSSNVAF